MAGTILALNAGSSTLKYTLYRFAAGHEQRLASATLKNRDLSGQPVDAVLERVAAHGAPALVVHRVVHGGTRYTAPVRVDGQVQQELQRLARLAPLHMPPALRLLESALARMPGAVHVACFDTAFHRDLPLVASRFALPAELHARGVRRYGFHGLSYQYVVSSLGSPIPSRLIVAHLGSGASLAAIRDGRSIDTTMGLTPNGGIPMGTRSGDLDPGILFHLAREHRYSIDALEELVNHQSGLQGLGGTSDVAELLQRATAHDRDALAALESFAYAVKKQIGAYYAVLGGLDCLVFTGGIGENAPLVRELACAGLDALGIQLDVARNRDGASLVSVEGALCPIRVIATDEDLVMARAAFMAVVGA